MPMGSAVRTCIGCRERAAKSELLRLVWTVLPQPGVIADPSQTQPGRGAYLHPSPNCLESAVRRRAFGRALKVSGTVDPAALTASVLPVLTGAG